MTIYLLQFYGGITKKTSKKTSNTTKSDENSNSVKLNDSESVNEPQNSSVLSESCVVVQS